MKFTKLIFLLLLFTLAKVTFGQFKSSYSYAYGTDEINVYWDYFYDYPEELLGCNLLRFESDPEQSIKINQGLITSLDKNFYFLDTLNIIDTIIYFYTVEFVFPNDTIWQLNYLSSFENIEFTIVGPTMIELIAIPKIQGNINVNVYWDMVLSTTLFFEDTFIIEMDPFYLEQYTNYISYNFWDLSGNNYGIISTSIFHLKELLLTQITDYSVPKVSMNNYPNPLTEYTNINVGVGVSNNFNITIYNSNGEFIKTLENKFLKTGEYYFKWNRRNDLGNRVPRGLYYCIISSSRMKKTLKLIVQ